MGIESIDAEGLRVMGESSQKLAEFWSSENGDSLRTIMAELTQGYMGEIMDGDPHAFRAVRAMHEMAKLLGDQHLYLKAIQVEFERRYRLNGGGER